MDMKNLYQKNNVERSALKADLFALNLNIFLV